MRVLSACRRQRAPDSARLSKRLILLAKTFAAGAADAVASATPLRHRATPGQAQAWFCHSGAGMAPRPDYLWLMAWTLLRELHAAPFSATSPSTGAWLVMDTRVQHLAPRARDLTTRPPERRQVYSADGRYKLDLRLLAAERPVRVEAEWVDQQASHGEPAAWLRLLPHEWGPRTAVVASSGAVVLLDDWIRRPSLLALSLLDLRGEIVACYGAEQIVQLLGASVPEVMAVADRGLWCTGEPELSEDGRYLWQRSAGRQLQLDLSNGDLRLCDRAADH